MWGNYWARVCAPKLRARKKEMGRGVPEREIAAYVESATGKRSERALINLWFLGKREPYISQFLALCNKLQVDPLEILRELPVTRKHFKGDVTSTPENEMRNNKVRKLKVKKT
jgi:hypothetical protein